MLLGARGSSAAPAADDTTMPVIAAFLERGLQNLFRALPFGALLSEDLGTRAGQLARTVQNPQLGRHLCHLCRIDAEVLDNLTPGLSKAKFKHGPSSRAGFLADRALPSQADPLFGRQVQSGQRRVPRNLCWHRQRPNSQRTVSQCATGCQVSSIAAGRARPSWRRLSGRGRFDRRKFATFGGHHRPGFCF